MSSWHILMEKQDIESETLSSEFWELWFKPVTPLLQAQFSHINNETLGFFRFFLILRISACKSDDCKLLEGGDHSTHLSEFSVNCMVVSCGLT